uniref:Uncharacterized protein n=1 Tax=Culex tarsalis TaxID=7177 RepID=A0A1Q3F9V6_CULTA
MPQVNGARRPDCESDRIVASVAAGEGSAENPESHPSNDPDPSKTEQQENCCHHNGKSESSTNQTTEPAPSEVDDEEAAAAAAAAELDSDGDCSEDNNSLGNLSYISENGLIEEIILLPNNIYSDDENGSDDCVYAYRGDLQAPALLEFRDQPADDETDFLEMDFDPEPSSELENLLEHQEISIDPFQHTRTVERSPETGETEPLLGRHDDEPDGGEGRETAVVPVETKNMGAIPKRLPAYLLQPTDDQQPGPSRPTATSKSNSRNLRLDLKLCTDEGQQSSYYYNYPYYNPRDFARNTGEDEDDDGDDEDEDNSCLDCTEKQFLMQTKQDLSVQKVCHRCHSRNASHGGGDYFHDQGPSLNSSNSETDLMSIRAEQIVMQALNKINELKATPPSLGFSRSAENVGCAETDARDQEVPGDFAPEIFSENTVTIYTLNCGELTIIEALTRIGVAPNLDVIRQYFTEQYAVDTSKMNIPQYLLYMSKRDCNFRKLIDTIKSCCEETLDVQYYPLDPFSDTPEVVQINSAEIAKRWNANTNLRQIISFKHKHFHKLNVLGKIVNILRQPSRGRNTNQTINIPQYYKSGSITITRIV